MKHLGDIVLSKVSFSDLDAVFKEFGSKDFLAFVDRKRSDRVNRVLLELIQKEKEPCFLLSAVLEFIERVDSANILQHYIFNSFELWLNQFSGLNFEENYRIRAKIAGKFIERGDYQAFFPIGMGKVYEGTHFVTAHKSPDLDTTIASFWGWLDSFAARVGDGMHVWNVPGGPPTQIEMDMIFRAPFGSAVFTHLVKTRTALHVTGSDLMTQKGMHRSHLSENMGTTEHDRDRVAIVLVDESGFYLGDWRSMDIESVREVILHLSTCLRWFENNLNLAFLEFFAKESPADAEKFLSPLFSLKVVESEPARDFTQNQIKKMEDFLTKVLHVKKDCTFEELGHGLKNPYQSLSSIASVVKKLATGSRTEIFSTLKKEVSSLHEGIVQFRARLERLDIALKTKTDVFGHEPTFVSVQSEVEEIRSKMGSYSYLTVNYPDRDKLYPVGIIHAADVRKNILGTVSLRDFCNRDEMGIPAYLEIISVIDHHKSMLNTSTPPFAIISDVQSSNTLIAKQAFLINDRKRTKTDFYVHKSREFTEYLQFLYGIIDDTDLLSKVTSEDVDVVAELLNRMKGSKIIDLDDIPRDKHFAKKAAGLILQNEDMYSLYRKVYVTREKEVESNMHLAGLGKPSNFFADTKEQNGCCRVGQTKIFATNIPFFEKAADSIRHTWVKMAEAVYKQKPEIALHIHMISTIVNAEEVYKGVSAKYAHKDELWIWIPKSEQGGEQAVGLLKNFLDLFQSSPGLKHNQIEVEFLGDNAKELALSFKESFLPIQQKITKSNLPIAILRYNAGTLNSRKAMITPYLPT